MANRLDPQTITPLHDIRDLDKLHDLIRSMTADGWEGRPLLVMPIGSCYQALTGTHRLEAAIQSGLSDVPVMLVNPWVDEALSCEEFEELESVLLHGTDEERVCWFERHRFAEAAELMLWEVP